MSLRPCKECGQQISSDAKACPHCGKKTGVGAGGCLLAILGVIVACVLIALLSDPTPHSTNSNLGVQVAPPSDDADLLLSRCGQPDVDDSTAYDNPRPPIPTRWIVYKKAGVQVMFVARGAMGSPPPYQWKLIGSQDRRTKQPLSVAEAVGRLPCWQKR